MTLEVICSHVNKESKYGNDCLLYKCNLCGAKWASYEDTPKIVIGHTQETGDLSKW